MKTRGPSSSLIPRIYNCFISLSHYEKKKSKWPSSAYSRICFLLFATRHKNPLIGNYKRCWGREKREKLSSSCFFERVPLIWVLFFFLLLFFSSIGWMDSREREARRQLARNSAVERRSPLLHYPWPSFSSFSDVLSFVCFFLLSSLLPPPSLVR